MQLVSSFESIRNATLSVLWIVILLQKTALAQPSAADQVRASLAAPPTWQASKDLVYRILNVVNPFVGTKYWSASLFVGMVKLTAVCGLGSAFWFLRHEKAFDAQHAALGKLVISNDINATHYIVRIKLHTVY